MLEVLGVRESPAGILAEKVLRLDPDNPHCNQLLHFTLFGDKCSTHLKAVLHKDSILQRDKGPWHDYVQPSPIGKG